MNCIQRVFGRSRVVLPVIHLPSYDAGMRAVEVAREAGADGVFLINQGMSAGDIQTKLYPELRKTPWWYGVNFLGYPLRVLLSGLPTVHGVWTDDAGVDAGSSSRLTRAMEDRAAARAVSADWLYFGGTAFKTQAPVSAAALPGVVRAARELMDVVTTSGRGTGVAATLTHVQAVHSYLEGTPMALASGITPENVAQYLPYCDAYLVATGIEKSFGVLDPERTRRLCDVVHGYGGG